MAHKRRKYQFNEAPNKRNDKSEKQIHLDNLTVLADAKELTKNNKVFKLSNKDSNFRLNLKK